MTEIKIIEENECVITPVTQKASYNALRIKVTIEYFPTFGRFVILLYFSQLLRTVDGLYPSCLFAKVFIFVVKRETDFPN